MEESVLEGTLVLEKLAEIGKVEEFFDAIDADNFDKARQLMQRAGVDQLTIQQVLGMMEEQ